MSEYTPATDEVRDAYAGHDFDHAIAAAQFDRWLAEIERAAAEKAWEQGHLAGREYQGDGWNADAHDPAEDNPYRRNEGENDVDMDVQRVR